MRMPGDAVAAEHIDGRGARGVPLENGTLEVALDPYGAAMVGWRRDGRRDAR